MFRQKYMGCDKMDELKFFCMNICMIQIIMNVYVYLLYNII